MKTVWMLASAMALVAGSAEARVAEKLAVLKPGAVVLMQGDSITDGGRWPGDDFNHIMGQDYAYILAGEIGLTYPERNLTFINRGVSGNTATDLAARWQADTLDLHPDVLSVMVGVNDTFYGKGETLEQYEAAYDKLLADTIQKFPNIRIVLGEPFLMPVKSYAEDYPAKRAELEKRQAVVKSLGAKYHLPVVLYQEAFDAALSRAPANTWSWDGVHPTYAGHALMAETWLRTVDTFWR